MLITEAYASNLAEDLREKTVQVRESVGRVARIIDPQVKGPGCDMPYPPDKGWHTALSQQTATALAEARTLVNWLELLQHGLETTGPQT